MASETYAPNPVNCVLGKGKLYFDRFDTSGNRTGFFELGNAKDLTAAYQSNRASVGNYLTSDGGEYAEAEVSKAITISCLLYEFNKKNIALLTGGTESTYTQSTQTVTGETLNSALALGAVYQTAYRSIATVVVKQGTTTLTTADYSVVDATAGLIKILTTGAATAGTPVTADYAATAITGTSQPIVELYNAGNILGQLLYVSNNSYGAQGEMKWWKVSVQPGDLAGLIGDDFGSSTLSFKSMNDSASLYGGSTTSPYGRWFRR